MRVLKDDQFIRGDVPMTKRDVRIYLMDALDIVEGLRALDIGAGTGAVSVEMARRGANVTAIETNIDGVKLIRENANRHDVEIDIIHGRAPEDLPDKEYDRIFIGGSKGKLEEIIIKSHDMLCDGGVVVMSFILIKNLGIAERLTKKYFKDVEITMVQTSNAGEKLGMLIGNNPIFIIRGVK